MRSFKIRAKCTGCGKQIEFHSEYGHGDEDLSNYDMIPKEVLVSLQGSVVVCGVCKKSTVFRMKDIYPSLEPYALQTS